MKARYFPSVVGATILASLPMAAAQADVMFQANGTGSLVIVPVDQTTLHETINMSFTTTTGPTLTTGVLDTLIDLTAPDIQSTLFDAHFSLTGPGGNGLFGTYSLTSSIFSTPIDETFSGVFDATSGTGAFAGDYGTGVFSGTNVYSDPTLPSAVTTMSVSGDLAVPEPPTLALLGFGLAALAIARAARR